MDERAGVDVPEFTPFARPSGHPGRMCQQWLGARRHVVLRDVCLLYTSDAADDMQCVDLGGRRIIKKRRDILFSNAG